MGVREDGEVLGGGGEIVTPLRFFPPHTPQVQNLGCYPVRNLTLRMALPSLGYRRAAFLSVTRVLAENVSPSPKPGVLGGLGGVVPAPQR